MKRLAACCALSVVLYVAVFGFVIDRPLSLGLLRLEIAQKTARLAALPSPKLVILAGSNAPYSHSCMVLGAMLNMPCENAGIAVGIGLDDLFFRDAPGLHAGDVLYMPMETDQYVMSRAQNRASTDDGILLRHDRYLLRRLPADRLLGAVFCCTLTDLLESLAEMPIAHAGVISPHNMLARQFNAEGDRTDATLATADRQLLNMPVRDAPDAAAVSAGYGAKLIGNFVATEEARGVTVIGGLPTEFQDIRLPSPTIAAIRRVYLDNAGMFLVLPNHSQYPRADFYDSKDHLAQPCQFLHSIKIALALAAVLHEQARKPPETMLAVAHTCP